MKTKIKRLSKSTVSLLLTLMMLFSCVTSSGAVTIKPESAPTTVDETAVNENTVEETIGDETAVGETAVDETPAQTDENTVTVDIEPEDVQTTVLTEEEIKGEQVEENTVLEEYSDKGNLGKKSPEKSGDTTYTFYFANIFKGDDNLWNTPYAYYWKGNTNKDTALTYSSQTGLYSITFDTSTYTNLIFHDSSSWNGQSLDLTVSGNENKIYVPASNYKDKGRNNLGFDGWWLTAAQYNESISNSKTIFFKDNVGWNGTTMYAYVWGPNATGVHVEMTKNSDGYYTATIGSEYQKVIFKKTTGWNANDCTVAYSLVGHDHLMLFNSCKSNEYFDKGTNHPQAGKRYGTWITANPYPEESDLLADTISTVSGWKMYIADNDNSFSAGTNKHYIATENGDDWVDVKQVTDIYGTTWYYSEVTPAQASYQMWFVLSVYGTDSNNETHWWFKNGSSSINVKSSNSIIAPAEKRERDGHYFGLVRPQKNTEKIKVYFNSLDGNNFNTYTVVPVTSTIPDGYVHVIAKDGTIRGDWRKYAYMCDTSIVAIGDANSRTNNGDHTFTLGSTKIKEDYYDGSAYYAEVADIEKGTKIKIRTQIHDTNDSNSEAVRSKYFVKAFNINGKTVWPNDKGVIDTTSGIYECEYTIPSDMSEDYLEITPVFFYNESFGNRNYITFIAENFVGEVYDEWGKTCDGQSGDPILACYAWYGTGQDTLNWKFTNKSTLGGYPGQPMVYENGHYIMQVPLCNDAGNHIQGITLNNYVWDFVHCYIKGATSDTQRSSINCQTYDYDDFAVLSYADPAPEFIVFRFKYETNKNQTTGTQTTVPGNGVQAWGNGDPGSTLTVSSYNDTNGNGWEVYDDYYGNTIDVFNNILENKDGTIVDNTYGANKNNYDNAKFHIVSTGYRDIYYGHFATLWYIYDDQNRFVGVIPSSALYYQPTGDMPVDYSTAIGFNTAELLAANVPWFLPFRSGTQYNETNDKEKTNDQEKLAYWQTYCKLYYGTDITTCALHHPAEITYETAIRAKDRNAYDSSGTRTDSHKHPADPGLRCDGNWYYSKKIPFNAEIVVMYKNGSGDEFTDSFIRGGSKPYAGQVTNAKAYFTNKTYTYKDTSNENKTVNFPGYLDYNANNVYSSSDGFQFTANFFTKGYTDATRTTPQNYMFDGWYVDIDGVLSPLDYIVSENGKATASTADMRGYTKIVAKYVPYQVSDQNISELEITHELLKKVVDNRLSGQSVEAALETIIGTDGNKIMPHEDLFNTNTTVTVYGCTKEDGTDGVEIGEYENQGDHSKIKIQFAGDNTYNYLKIVLTSSHSNGNPTTNDFFYEENGSYYKSSEATNTYVNTQGTKANIVNGETCTYIIPVENIYDNNKFKTNVLSFYSDPQKVIDVIIKYYDREVQDNTAAHISKTPTIYKINYSVAPYGTQGGNTEENFIADNTGIFEKFKGIDNILDKYKFWLSQEQALDANTGIKSMKFYRYAKDKSPGNDSTYGEFYSTLNNPSEHAKDFIVSGDSSYNSYIQNTTVTDLQYHTMYNGLPQYELTDNTTYTPDDIQYYFDGENWVNYYSSYDSSSQDKEEWSGDPIQGYDSSQWSQVNAVVIWGYNAPKEYTFTAYYTPEQDDKTVVYDKSKETAGTDEVLVNQNFIITEVDKATTYVHTYENVDPQTQNVLIDVTPNAPIKGFFNQRIGTPAGGRTDISPYLVDYGIETALFGDSGTSNGTEVLAPETVKYKAESAQTAVDYEFDGWYIYDSLGFHKFSSEISYRERVVCNLTLYAGFVEKQQQTNTYHDKRGLAVTWNGVDYLVDSDGEDKVRVNTEICVYGTEITESDEQITDIASIYFKLPTFGTIGENGQVVPINWNDSANKAKLVEYFNEENGYYSKELRKQILSHLRKLENFYKNGNDDSDYRTKDRNFSVNIAIENVNLTNPEPGHEGQYGLVDCFSYRVYDSVDHPNEGTFKLTNKNRLQFVYKMLKTDYESQPFMAYVAMRCHNYSDSNGSRIYGNEHTWYLSDNFVSNCGIEDAKFILPTSYPPVDPVLGDDNTVEDHLAVIEEGASGTIVETDTFTSDVQNEISNETDQPTDEGNQTAQQNQDGLLEQQDSTLDNVPIDDSELVT